MHNILGKKPGINRTFATSNNLMPNLINKSPLIFEGINNNKVKTIPQAVGINQVKKDHSQTKISSTSFVKSRP